MKHDTHGEFLAAVQTLLAAQRDVTPRVAEAIDAVTCGVEIMKTELEAMKAECDRMKLALTRLSECAWRDDGVDFGKVAGIINAALLAEEGT